MKKKTGNVLTRKFGPLPAWAWLALFAVGVWYYRNKLSSASTSTSTTGTTTTTPQSPTVLQPGESLYDPNTGTLTTAPGSSDGSGGGTTAPDYTGLAAAIEDAIQAGQQQSPPPSTNPAPDNPSNTPAVTPVTPAITPHAASAPALTGRGAIRAPFGPKKPTAPKGYSAIGLGRGFWEFKPTPASNKRSQKPKNQHASKSGTTAPTRGTTRARSGSTVRNAGGGTARVRGSTSVLAGRPRGAAKATASKQRTRSSTAHTQPLVTQPVTVQRPVANATPVNRPPAQPSVHRTASTPARTTRTPSKSPPKKKTVKKR